MLTDKYFDIWLSLLDIDLDEELHKIKQRKWTAENFKFATAVSVMSSSKIEGETLEVDSYVKHKMLHIEYLPNLTEKPNDLFAAYEFARDNPLTYNNLIEAHSIATQHLLPKNQQGELRTGNMLIMDQQTQRIQYEAAPAQMVESEYELFWNDLNELLQKPLSTAQTFYYAALIHLVFVKIHPFNDGNGRTARLLEKWFITSKIGEKGWYVASELFYFNHLQQYYHNLARVGLLYENLQYEKSIPFLLMLPKALNVEK